MSILLIGNCLVGAWPNTYYQVWDTIVPGGGGGSPPARVKGNHGASTALSIHLQGGPVSSAEGEKIANKAHDKKHLQRSKNLKEALLVTNTKQR